MHPGSIHNPVTREAQLFAFLREHVGQEFTALELGPALQSRGPSPCAHTYVCGVRVQCAAEGYEIPRARYCREKQTYVYIMLRAAKRGEQMELAGACV